VGKSADFMLAHEKGVMAKQTSMRKEACPAGFVNGHTHVAMTLLRGLRDDVTWTNGCTNTFFLRKRKTSRRILCVGDPAGSAEQIHGGITTFADMYYFEDAVAQETKAAGMRGVLARLGSISSS